jgi:hypothetical protein
MRGKRDAFGVDPGTGFDGVRATEAELEAWRKANPGRSRPAVARSRCQRCGTRIWHSGIAVGAHRGSKKCRETEARLNQAAEQAREQERQARQFAAETCARRSGTVWSPDGGRHGLFVLGDGVIEG